MQYYEYTVPGSTRAATPNPPMNPFGLGIYPNPTVDIINVVGFENLKDVTSIQLIDRKGAVIRKIDILDKTISLRGLNAGVYYLEVTHSERKTTLPFVKER